MLHQFLDQRVYKHLREFLEIEEPTTLQTPNTAPFSLANLIAHSICSFSWLRNCYKRHLLFIIDFYIWTQRIQLQQLGFVNSSKTYSATGMPRRSTGYYNDSLHWGIFLDYPLHLTFVLYLYSHVPCRYPITLGCS
jgi:hypothetical protein